jgi:hypothetical protein
VAGDEVEMVTVGLELLPPARHPTVVAAPPKEEDLAKGILEAIDMDSYRAEKKAAIKIALADKDAEIEPVPTDVPFNFVATWSWA